MSQNYSYIVLADDDPDDRMLFCDAFDELKINTKVRTFNNGLELMEHLSQNENPLPHILFLDLNMPLMSGKECLQQIKSDKKFDQMAIAIYSTSASEQDIEDTFISGANIYIKKPNDFNTLKKVLSDVVTINWQYHTSGLNKENFLLRL